MRKITKPSQRRSAAEWSRLVDAWRRSGQQAEQFARRRRIGAGTLRWWAWYLGKSGRGQPAAGADGGEDVRLVPVEINAVGPEHGAEWVVELRDGTVLRVRGELSESSLRAILEAGSVGGEEVRR